MTPSSCPSRFPWSRLCRVLPLGVLLTMTGCGSGGSSTTPPPPDFSLSVSPTSQSVTGGTSASVLLSATGINGFASQISVQVGGLPAAVSISPANITLMPGTPQQVTLTAAANAAAASANVTFTGTSGSLSHMAPLALTVVAAPPPADFSLSVTPVTPVFDAGDSISVSLSATAINGFNSQISVQVTGMPAAVAASPASFSMTPGTPQQITFTAAANTASISNVEVLFTGTSGSLTHSTDLVMAVNAQLSTRTRYVRTDATTEYYLYANQNWAIYNPNTSRFFVTDLSTSNVFVFDDATQSEISVIKVPGAFGIGDTPDHSTLYVGTLIGDVYALDPVAMAVTQRYLASQIGPSGYPTLAVRVLANGDLVLQSPSSGFAVWNPATNAFNDSYICGPGLSTGNVAGFTLSADRTKIIVGAGFLGGLCELDPANGTWVSNSSSVANDSFSYNVLVSPDGKYIIQPANYPSQAVLYDANTLVELGDFQVLSDSTDSDSGFFISSDSSTLYTPDNNWIYAYDIATQQQIGWVSNLFVPPTSGGEAVAPISNPFFLATDGSGLFVGPLEEGVGFMDLSSLQPFPAGEGGSDLALDPAVGPVSGGTGIQWPNNSAGTVYFATQEAFNVSVSGNYTSATTPPGSPGPVPVYDFAADGGLQLIPDGFSYGPTVLEAMPNMATAEGGGTGYLYGYGFGPIIPNTLPPYPIPSDLQVSVGGASAVITAYSQNPLNLGSPPFPLVSASYTVPPGAVSSTNLTVTNNSGTTTLSGGFAYLPAIHTYPLTGSALAEGIYDSYRDVYYFTDTNQIQVFSRTLGGWQQPPIPIPAPQGATQRLWGIALSPDGSRLAVSDLTAEVIYLLDPASPSSVKTFPVPQQFGFVVNATGLAISDSGNIYYGVLILGGSGGQEFFKLDTATGVTTSYDITQPGGPDQYLRAVITSDNSRVFFNREGGVFYVDTATDAVVWAPDNCSPCNDYELALSSDQTRVLGGSFFYDSNLNAESYDTLNDREILNISYVYGAKLSSDGRLLFQPSTNGIDVFDGYLGSLLDRISLSVALSSNYDALVSDGKDDVFLAITGTGDGIATVDLTSIAEPPALPYTKNAFGNRRAAHKLDTRPARGRRTQTTLGKAMRSVPHVTRFSMQYQHR